MKHMKLLNIYDTENCMCNTIYLIKLQDTGQVGAAFWRVPPKQTVKTKIYSNTRTGKDALPFWMDSCNAKYKYFNRMECLPTT